MHGYEGYDDHYATARLVVADTQVSESPFEDLSPHAQIPDRDTIDPQFVAPHENDTHFAVHRTFRHALIAITSQKMPAAAPRSTFGKLTVIRDGTAFQRRFFHVLPSGGLIGEYLEEAIKS